MRHTSQLHIDLSAIDHNMRVLRRLSGGAKICPIVKADAYGLGAARIARQLAECGADMLAVYTLQQAVELAGVAVPLPILVLMPVRTSELPEPLYRLTLSGQLHLTVHDLAHLRQITALAEQAGAAIPVHVEIDTGMSRGGCALTDTPALLQAVTDSPQVRLAGVFTHFASAERDEELTRKQLAMFDELLLRQAARIPADCLIHAANTFATLRHRRYHKTMIRVGLAWTGFGIECMSGDERLQDTSQLWPCLTWSSRIVHEKTIPAGATVGYGATWTARRASRIGLVPVGYADGYPIGLGASDARPEGARVVIAVPTAAGVVQVFAPVVGTVNMDQITIDLSDAPHQAGVPGDCIGVDTMVELITPHPSAPNHLTHLASLAATIPHEMLCRLNPRIPRLYRDTAGAVTQRAEAAIAAG